MLDETTARRYATAWAKKVSADMQDLQQGPGGDFFGELGSLGFDYSAKERVLAVRAYIFAYSAEFAAQPDIVPWLNKIAAEKPDTVSYGVFESCVPRWEPDKEPSLFLRIDLKDGSERDSAVLARLIGFRENAMVKKRRQEKGIR